MNQALQAALENITRHGDTDVFPFPIENQIFFDRPAQALALLMQIHGNLSDFLADQPPVNQSMLAAVGYTGFRWATQLDPPWNAYLLGLVIAIAEDIEGERIPADREVVFSYRYKWNPDRKTLFDPDWGWLQFQLRSVELAERHEYVLTCDIADFYPRIYHHRLENALRRATSNHDAVNGIMEILKRFSRGVSYGLPVGGPAARLLSELLLNRVDRLLVAAGVTFCRFADDYHIFASSAEDAYGKLIFLSEKLLENEGLLLQKAKTRILSRAEFLSTSEISSQNRPESEAEDQSREFLRLRLHFDPYSPTREEDYEHLKSELARFDVVEMLTREMAKSRVHQALTRRLISALQYLDTPVLSAAVISLVENIAVLYPVFPNVILLIKSVIARLDPAARETVFRVIRDLVRSDSYIIRVPTNLSYAVHLLAYDLSEETDAILSRIFAQSEIPVIRRDVILAMARRESDYWVSDVKNTFIARTGWERIAIIISSYTLGDEGNHWRSSVRKQLSPLEQLAAEWAAERKQRGNWEIPL